MPRFLKPATSLFRNVGFVLGVGGRVRLLSSIRIRSGVLLILWLFRTCGAFSALDRVSSRLVGLALFTPFPRCALGTRLSLGGGRVGRRLLGLALLASFARRALGTRLSFGEGGFGSQGGFGFRGGFRLGQRTAGRGRLSAATSAPGRITGRVE